MRAAYISVNAIKPRKRICGEADAYAWLTGACRTKRDGKCGALKTAKAIASAATSIYSRGY